MYVLVQLGSSGIILLDLVWQKTRASKGGKYALTKIQESCKPIFSMFQEFA
jgi:hypothetical protein